jgi:hypothetical protein
MTAYEPLNGHDFDARRDQVREAYLNAFSDIVDRALEEFILPTEREQIIQDVALFVPFLMAVKLAEQKANGLDKSALLSGWWPMQRRMKVEVPEMLLNFATQHAGGAR